MSEGARGSRDFKDHFSGHSAEYREARPHYPSALFHFLAIVAPSTQLAWDAGTGNGQAAVPLASRFTTVVATDGSDEMLAQAERHPRVRYEHATYRTSLADRSVGIVTVAQALHWFDVDAFIREVRRVLVPDGLLAAWCYTGPRISPDIDAIHDHFHQVIVGPYWPPERRHVEDGYRAIALPIDEYAVPPFEMVEDWTLAQFLGYVRTWSATRRYVDARGEAQLLDFERAIAEVWGEPRRTRRLRFPMHFRVGEVR